MSSEMDPQGASDGSASRDGLAAVAVVVIAILLIVLLASQLV